MSARRRAEAGLTVIELLVTLILASVVAGGTFAFFTGQQRIYESQAKILNVQQTLWAATEILGRHVRAAGGGMTGCVRPDFDGAGADTGDPPPGSAVAPATGLRAARAGVLTRIAPLWIRNGVAGAPDTITVAFGNRNFGNFSDAALEESVSMIDPLAQVRTVAGLTAVFRADEFVLLVDTDPPAAQLGDRGCTLAQITSVAGATDNLIFAPTSTWNAAGLVPGLVPFTYTGGAGGTGALRHFGRLTWVQFSIDRPAGLPPRLMMERLDGTAGPQILAEGIEDLQVAYACDLQPAGATDGQLREGTDAASRLADEWFYNVAGDVVSPACNRPLAVRITLVGRSLAADTTMGGVNNAAPAVEDGAGGAPDQFRHRVATTTIYPRH